jgi:hypothetical protein
MLADMLAAMKLDSEVGIWLRLQREWCVIFTIHSLDPFCPWIFKRVRPIPDAVFIPAFGGRSLNKLHCYEPCDDFN